MKKYKPMLAKTVENPFSSKGWIFEIKWDGIRAISYVNEELIIKSRNQKDITKKFPEFKELKQLTKKVVLDGEIIVMKNGKENFQTVLKRLQANSSREIKKLQLKNPSLYILFDILEKNGESLINKTLIERKKILKETVKEGKNVLVSVFVEQKGEQYYKVTIEKGLEGIMAKRMNSRYTPGIRSSNWFKIKKTKECDCVIFGYTKGEGNRKKTFGSLLLGLYEKEKPVFVGKVGTGFTQKLLEDLHGKMEKLKVNRKTLQIDGGYDKIVWVKPVLVCKIKYQILTSNGKLRMSRFVELRKDKKPTECKLEQIKPVKLKEYLQKRDFTKTPEPTGLKKEKKTKIFVVQKHNSSHLHYDMRLEKEGVLKSWAIPKGIPQKPGIKKLAINTEDHPLDYAKFEGKIPKGQYGAGTVKIWDSGTYSIKSWNENKIEFSFEGKKLQGSYVLIHFKKGGEKNWLLMKIGK